MTSKVGSRRHRAAQDAKNAATKHAVDRARMPAAAYRPWLAPDAMGVLARTQELARLNLETARAIERRLPVVEPLAYIARVRKDGIKFAQWVDGRRRPRWTVNPIEATGFRSQESAAGALRALTLRALKRLERSGTRYELWRLLP